VTRAERQEIATEKAKELMSEVDFDTLNFAILQRVPVLFKYTDRHGVFSQYRAEIVDSFLEFPATEFFEGSINIWCFHSWHDKHEQYNVIRIFDVQLYTDLIGAIINPSSAYSFWGGDQFNSSTVPL
jgi:hypothetical protein